MEDQGLWVAGRISLYTFHGLFLSPRMPVGGTFVAADI